MSSLFLGPRIFYELGPRPGREPGFLFAGASGFRTARQDGSGPRAGDQGLDDAHSAAVACTSKMLDRSSPVPLYHQLKEEISRLIENGTWSPETQLPGEREMCDRFGISRITVRQAIHQLVSEGRLLRAHGRGTFVAHSPLRKWLLP